MPLSTRIRTRSEWYVSLSSRDSPLACLWRVPHGRPFGYLKRGLSSRGAFLWRCAIRVNTCVSRLRPHTSSSTRAPAPWDVCIRWDVCLLPAHVGSARSSA
eukprot:6746416-Prymnesium_polylepis.2